LCLCVTSWITIDQTDTKTLMFDLQLVSLLVKLQYNLTYNAIPIALQLANLVIVYK